MNLEQTHQFMIQGLEEQIFTGAVLLVSHRKEEIFSRAYGKLGDRETPSVTERTLFDLASLTKILATTPVWISAGVMPSGDFGPADIRMVSRGSSGQRENHAETFACPYLGLACLATLLSVPSSQISMMQLAKNEVLNEPLDYQTGQASVYSDLGFILLAAIAELESGQTFNSFCRKQIYEPSGNLDTT